MDWDNVVCWAERYELNKWISLLGLALGEMSIHPSRILALRFYFNPPDLTRNFFFSTPPQTVDFVIVIHVLQTVLLVYMVMCVILIQLCSPIMEYPQRQYSHTYKASALWVFTHMHTFIQFLFIYKTAPAELYGLVCSLYIHTRKLSIQSLRGLFL